MTFYVATRARYELVEAPDAAQALYIATAQFADKGIHRPTILVVRPATPDEIELGRMHEEAGAAELAASK